MANDVNPLERGKELDILLNALMNAGVDQPTLAFMLGVNPDTLSAYLLRTSVAGSLNVVAGDDWFSEGTQSFVVIPSATYNLNAGQIFPIIRTDGARLWEFSIWGATALNNLQIPSLQLNIAFEGGPSSVTMFLPFGLGYLNQLRIFLPKCAITPTVGADATLGNWTLAVNMQSVPVGG